jgi:hypothetical protein
VPVSVKKRDEDHTVFVSPHMARQYPILKQWTRHWVRIVSGKPVHSGSLCRKCNGGRS